MQEHIKHNSSSSNNTTQQIKKHSSVDYKYICIKKDVFDISMMYLTYDNLKKKKFIEIIYKSPSVFLEGLFFKTPPISKKDIIIYYKEHKNNYYNKYNNQPNTPYISNPTIKLLLNYKEHTQIINILRSIDENISKYINQNSFDIEDNLKKYYNDTRMITSFNYEQIIKFKYNNIIELHMKSYLDKEFIEEIEKLDVENTKGLSNNDNTNSNDNANANEKKYSFTFNISNIYFSNNNNLLPLVKCNRFELVI
jgi:hypothetical protein